MKKQFRDFCMICLLVCANPVFAQEHHYTLLLKKMFKKVTIEKNEKAISVYYDNDFKLFSNGKMMGYAEFLKMHQAFFKTPIHYSIRYDDNTFVEHNNKVAGRLFITTKNPHEPAHEIEVVLIVEYKADKLYRAWELTYPDWSQMKAFKPSVQH